MFAQVIPAKWKEHQVCQGFAIMSATDLVCRNPRFVLVWWQGRGKASIKPPGRPSDRPTNAETNPALFATLCDQFRGERLTSHAPNGDTNGTQM